MKELLNHHKFLNSLDNNTKKKNHRYLNKINNRLIEEVKNKFWSKKNKIFLDKELNKKYNKRLSPDQLIKKMYK